MSNMKIENWMRHEIRFIEIKGEWWAVLSDITNAIELVAKEVRRRLPDDVVSKHPLLTPGGKQEVLVVNEYGIYETIFQSSKKEAKEFQRWVFNMLRTLREATGLEGFQIFRMLDKDHQNEAMATLQAGLENPHKVSYIKANSIANNAVSTVFGHKKSIKKEDMSPEMLVARQSILNDAVELMMVKHKYELDLSTSEKIYSKYQ